MTSVGTAQVRRIVRTLAHEGPRGLAQRVVRRAYRAVDAAGLDFPLLPGDIADSASVAPQRSHARALPGVPTVGWLMTPPALGSGGHTTIFRMVTALEAAGIRCVLFLYDRHGGDASTYAERIRVGWPRVQAAAVNVGDTIDTVDGCFATSWESAHVLALRASRNLKCFYFIQDYEPFFYPRGSLYELAEDTYRFGFQHVALGEMVAAAIRNEVGVDSDVVPFGCDSDVYKLAPSATERTGVVFYAKPEVPRRGYVHARLALEEFSRRHPEQEIHVYGDKITDLPMPVTWHGRMWPNDLNALYNRTLGGFAMSFTNISLVAEEMLSAGCIPVVNDSPLARADLDSPYVAWARPTPHALADALCQVVEHADPAARAMSASASARKGWGSARDGVVRIVEEALVGPRHDAR
jgi:glycosyltransferase involved in cell wall biosynthesis